MRRSQPIGISFNPETLETIDVMRGQVPRSIFVTTILEEFLTPEKSTIPARITYGQWRILLETIRDKLGVNIEATVLERQRVAQAESEAKLRETMEKRRKAQDLINQVKRKVTLLILNDDPNRPYKWREKYPCGHGTFENYEWPPDSDRKLGDWSLEGCTGKLFESGDYTEEGAARVILSEIKNQRKGSFQCLKCPREFDYQLIANYNEKTVQKILQEEEKEIS